MLARTGGEVRKAAFLVDNGFSEADYMDAASVLEKDGWFVRILSPAGQSVQAWKGGAWGGVYAVTGGIAEITAGDYDLLAVPGGQRSVEKLKLNPDLGPVLHGFLASRRPVIVYNHALGLMLEGTDILTGRTVAAPEELAPAIRAAGGAWVRASAMISGDLLTLVSRKPAFSKEILGFLKKLTVMEKPAMASKVRSRTRRNKAA